MATIKALCKGGINTIKQLVESMLETKVDKVSGKGLSTNDYTTEEKNKLAGIAAGAQVNVVETVKVNGTALTPSSKAVNIDLSAYAKKTDITSAYIYKGSKATYDALPSSGNTAGDVWNVETDGMNYAWTGSAWDALGGTVDLSAYATTDAMNSALANKVDKVSGKGLSTNDYTTAEKNKLAGLSNYTHPTGDGNMHVPANGTTNGGKFLMAGSTAGTYTWETVVEELTAEEITAAWNGTA